MNEKANLVLINESATGYQDLAKARDEIIGKVYDKFGYWLEQEPVEIFNKTDRPAFPDEVIRAYMPVPPAVQLGGYPMMGQVSFGQQVSPGQMPPSQVPFNQMPPSQIPPNQAPFNQISPDQISPSQTSLNQAPFDGISSLGNGKILNGSELAGFVNARQAHQVAGLNAKPRLLIIRDSDNPVITKYVNLKIKYGEDIGVAVEDYLANSVEDISKRIIEANGDPGIFGIILQLPIVDKEKTDELTALIASSKDVDGLSGKGEFDSATATAINWLLAGYDIALQGVKIAIVGRGKLVGAPLYEMFVSSGYDVQMFHKGDDLTKLKDFDIIISATGVPGLISGDMIKPGATIVDAGTASEDGRLVGDIDESVRRRTDLRAITPVIGGVGPLTVACLFEHVIEAATGSWTARRII